MKNKFCENLTRIRKESGLKQGDLASMLGVGSSTVSSWESGSREPSIENILKICNILDCSTDRIFGIDNKNVVVKRYNIKVPVIGYVKGVVYAESSSHALSLARNKCFNKLDEMICEPDFKNAEIDEF